MTHLEMAELRERIVRLEVQNANMAETQKEILKHVKRVNEMLAQAKGARWGVIAFATLGGGGVVAMLQNLFHKGFPG